MIKKTLVLLIAVCFALTSICWAEGKGVGPKTREFHHQIHQKVREQKITQKEEDRAFRESLKGMSKEERKAAKKAHRETQKTENKTFKQQVREETKAFIKDRKAEHLEAIEKVKIGSRAQK